MTSENLSSCACSHPKYLWTPTFQNKNGTQSSLGINDCFLSNNLNENNWVKLNSSIQPNFPSEKGIKYLNETNIKNLYAPDFFPISCPTLNCKKSWASWDPRLINVPHAQNLVLDKPPLDASIELKNIYTDKNLLNYKPQRYKTYSDIKTGQISYYIDKEIQDPFFKPVFADPSQTTSLLFKDPMGSIKPEYIKKYQQQCSLVGREDSNQNFPYQLSSIRDSSNHRQDLMASQQSVNNRQKYSARYPLK